MVLFPIALFIVILYSQNCDAVDKVDKKFELNVDCNIYESALHRNLNFSLMLMEMLTCSVNEIWRFTKENRSVFNSSPKTVITEDKTANFL